MSAARAHFERLVAEHERDVLRACRSVLRDEHLGKDAAQEVFVRLWRALGEGRSAERWAAWLRRAAVTVSLDLRRRAAARPLALAEVDATSPRSDPADSAAARELEARLERALETLPEGQRTIFLLRHEGGYALPEIAATLGVALPTVKTQFARAALKLQCALRPFDPEDRP